MPAQLLVVDADPAVQDLIRLNLTCAGGNHAYLDERTVDAHVGRLRSALQATGHQEHIETVRAKPLWQTVAA
jgi:hypothetical protein